MTPAAVAAAAERVRERIAAAGRDPAEVLLLAVTKGFGAEAVQAAVGAGLVDVGESYGQELRVKAEELAATDPAPRWHLLGGVQRNKVASLAPLVALWQSVDRAEEIRAIASHAPGAAVLLQVNLSGDPERQGCTFAEVPRLLDAAGGAGLDVQGLMGVGPAGDPELARSGFAALASAAAAHRLPTVSMGMTADLEVAVQEGSTMVRVGTALFGPRPRHPQVRR